MKLLQGFRPSIMVSDIEIIEMKVAQMRILEGVI